VRPTEETGHVDNRRRRRSRLLDHDAVADHVHVADDDAVNDY
jgi:hypothetical protein